MMKRIHIPVAALLMLVFTKLQAQDALFSQFHYAPNLLNPAVLSIQNAALKIDLNYREQGGGASSGPPISTFQVLANYAQNSFKSDKLSYGLSVLNDRGGQGHLTSNMAHIHLAYLKKLTGKYSKIGEHFIGLGTSLGAGQKSIDTERFWFGNQFNVEYNFIEGTKDPREDLILASASGRSNIFTDMNAGLVWYSNLSEDLSMTAGFSVYHMEMADISLFDGIVDRQLMRYAAHLSASKKTGDRLFILPRIAYAMQGGSSQILFGSELAVDNRDSHEFVMKFGGFGRVVSSLSGYRMDAVVLTLNMGYEDFIFGVGYDLIVSTLSTESSSRSAWELRLGYALKAKLKRGRRNVSIFTY